VNNTIPLPAGPFFCADEGRYLPSLTPCSQISDRRWEIVEALAEVEIEFAAMEQGLQIEEELFKIKLKQKCFAALAERAPAALVVRSEELGVSSSELGVRSSIKVFPLGPVSTKGTSNIQPTTGSAGLEPAAENGALRQQCPTTFGVYPKGRW
jgi:hypothetical protein